MKADNKARRMLGELQQLIDRWELDLDAKPVWWRRHPAVGDVDALGGLATDSPRKGEPQRSGAGKTVARSKPPKVQSHRRGAGTGRERRR